MIAKIRVFNDYEIMKLLQNPNVIAIRHKSQIMYSPEFKYHCVMQRLERPDKTARKIFEEAGFDMDIIHERTPQKRICYWLKQYEKFGEDYFFNNNSSTYKAITKKHLILTRDSLQELSEVYNEAKQLLQELENEKINDDV
ncbi:MAG: hypothetical protein IJY25_03945 [Bacilli bacterium]|nr:hypothetical protein [Bacilli bacterium]